MNRLKLFSKAESLSLIIIFLVLVAISIPNFIISLRRSRDQVRRDDMGALEHSLDEYFVDLGAFPPSSPDGRIMDCLKPGDAPYKDNKGRWIVNPIPCEWGKDAFLNLINKKSYLSTLPRDPDSEEGVSYYYMSDGARFQLFTAMEGKDEAEVDPRIIARNLPCGNKICNAGRFYGCTILKTLQECQIEAELLLRK